MMEHEIAEILSRHGGVAAGVSIAGEVEESAWQTYLDWIARGDHAGMEYMTRHSELRRNPSLLIENAESIISIAFPFKPTRFRNKERGMIACYAYGDDYHDALRKRLQEAAAEITTLFGGNHRICIDSAPVMERYWAVKSGIGSRGLSGAVIVPGAGSMVFLAEIITTLKLTPGVLFADTTAGLTCDSCGVCRNRCPGKAIRPDGTVDSRRCISYLTIEHRGPWETADAMQVMATPEGKDTIFGCDICLRACHLNMDIVPSELPELTPRDTVMNLGRGEIAGMTQEEFSRIFRGSPIKRCKFTGLKRNIGIKAE